MTRSHCSRFSSPMVLRAILLLSTSMSAQTIEPHAVLDAKPVLEPKAQTFIDAAPTKLTVVLVHGAFADASSWNGSLGCSKKDGYPVVAVANPVCFRRRELADGDGHVPPVWMKLHCRNGFLHNQGNALMDQWIVPSTTTELQ
jgi:hypothetical protein